MKYFMIAVIAKRDQSRLNQIRVGRVFTVDDQMREMLVTKAMIYSHHNWVSNRSPGIIIAALVINAANSTVLGLFQYLLLFMLSRA
jgi:hypothetical protein